MNALASTKTRPTEVLLDMNAGTHPFELVQQWLDEAVYFNLRTHITPQSATKQILNSSGEVIGFETSDQLLRFQIDVRPQGQDGVKAGNTTGQQLGASCHRLMFIPDDFVALPGQDPPATVFDPARSQRFVVFNGTCIFHGGNDGFSGFGTGYTIPIVQGNHRCLMAAVIGNISNGFGRFKGVDGTYTCNGFISPTLGLSGNLLIRVMDPERRFRATGTLPGIRSVVLPQQDITYIVFRGQKRSKRELTQYRFGSEKQILGFDLKQELRRIELDSAFARGNVYCHDRVDKVIGEMTSSVNLNILNPGAPGTGFSPIAFTSRNVFTFRDCEGRSVGSIAAEKGEGRSFVLKIPQAPDQQALRFGALQSLGGGTGCFENAAGILTDNSAVGVAPHATSTMYTLAIYDPQKTFTLLR